MQRTKHTGVSLGAEADTNLVICTQARNIADRSTRGFMSMFLWHGFRNPNWKYFHTP